MPDDNALQALVRGAYDLLEFGHDPVAGSWQVPPDAGSINMAGSLLKDALAVIAEGQVVRHSDWGGRRLLVIPLPEVKS